MSKPIPLNPKTPARGPQTPAKGSKASASRPTTPKIIDPSTKVQAEIQQATGPGRFATVADNRLLPRNIRKPGTMLVIDSQNKGVPGPRISVFLRAERLKLLKQYLPASRRYTLQKNGDTHQLLWTCGERPCTITDFTYTKYGYLEDESSVYKGTGSATALPSTSVIAGPGVWINPPQPNQAVATASTISARAEPTPATLQISVGTRLKYNITLRNPINPTFPAVTSSQLKQLKKLVGQPKRYFQTHITLTRTKNANTYQLEWETVPSADFPNGAKYTQPGFLFDGTGYRQVAGTGKEYAIKVTPLPKPSTL